MDDRLGTFMAIGQISYFTSSFTHKRESDVKCIATINMVQYVPSDKLYGLNDMIHRQLSKTLQLIVIIIIIALYLIWDVLVT